MTLADALDAFILEQRLRGNSPATVHAYRWILTTFIEWLGENDITGTDALKLSHVQKYQLQLDSRSAAPGTFKTGKLKKRSIQTYMRHIKVFLTFCHNEGFISEPIHGKVRLPKAERPVIEILTAEEIEVVLSCFTKSESGLRNRALVMLLLDCGLRIAEVVGIETENINFESGYVKVIGKGRRERIVPVGLKVRRAMLAYVHKRRAADAPEDNKFFFLTKERKPMTVTSAKLLMRRLKKKTGITRLHAHLFRHTFATNYLVYNIGDVYELSRLLGHSNIQTTEMYLQLKSYYTILKNRKRKTYLDSL